MITKNELYGDQTPHDHPDDISNIFIDYLTFLPSANKNNPMALTTTSIARASTKNLRSYVSLTELFEDKILLPENSKKYSIQTLKHHINADSNRSPGILYEEFNVVAYSGINLYDRPIAKITFRKNAPEEYSLYFPTPDFNKLVKRI